MTVMKVITLLLPLCMVRFFSFFCRNCAVYFWLTSVQLAFLEGDVILTSQITFSRHGTDT